MRFSTLSLVSGLWAIAQAHIIMIKPAPFSGVSQSPISEADFPCQNGGYNPPAGGAAVYPLGSKQELAFVGSAVHGGGSCQVSITYDKAPNKNSVFKVIHTIHGGCPMRNIQGNQANSNAQEPIPDTYPFTVPTDLPTGDAVLAWTWFNRIGNREMYMNCAPITITGGSTRRDEEAISSQNETQLIQRDIASYNALPNIYKANLDPSPSACHGLGETINMVFDYPGSSVETNSGVGTFGNAPACGNNGNTGGSTPSQPASSVIAPPASSTSTPPKATLPGAVFRPTKGEENPTATATTASPAVSSAPGTSAAVVVPTPTAQPTTLTVIPTKASSVAPPAGTGSPQTGALSGPCSDEGVWNCIGGTSFQRCASGSWSVVQSVAAGTTCGADGQTKNFAISAIGRRDGGKASGSRRALHRAHIRHHIRSS